ncbi:MAG: dihydrofolate reductase family protein [Chitinophagaceae bacterium]
MRKLKLQIQISIDGFVARPNGMLDWMTFIPDEQQMQYVNDFTDAGDTILLGRKMADGFVNFWTSVVLNGQESPKYDFARKMVDTPKIVFTKTLDESPWANTVLAKGDLVEEVKTLKAQEGKDIIVYGGVSFVSSLIKADLIDEYHLFVNPVMIGKGLRIFDEIGNTRKLQLENATGFTNGVAVLFYGRVR